MVSINSNTIQNLIGDIREAQPLNNETFTAIVESRRLTASTFSNFEKFNHPGVESYGRALIHDNGNFKIMLMSWLPGDFTAIHSHGFVEWGCVCFFGDISLRQYEFSDDTLKMVEKQTSTEGIIAPVHGDLIHIMGNAGKRGITTLHIYGSNSHNRDISKDSKVYYPECQKLVTTMGSAFLIQDSNLVLHEMRFSSVNKDLLADYFDLVSPYYERNNRTDIIEQMKHCLMPPK